MATRHVQGLGDGVGLPVWQDVSIGIASTALAVTAMAVDHLAGDDPGLEDPTTFAISAALSVAVALWIFGRVIPRMKADPAPGRRAAKVALVLSLLAFFLAPLTLWLGLPFVLAGGGVALGLLGRDGEASRRAGAAVVIGGIVLVVATSAYLVQAIDKLA